MAAPSGPLPFRGPPPNPMESMGVPFASGVPPSNNFPPNLNGPFGRPPSFGDEGEPPMKRMREGNGPPPPMWGGPIAPGPRPPMQDPGKDRSMASVFYKTRMCKNLAYPGGCPYHEKCNYAHSEEELRTLPPEYAAAVEGEAIEVKKHRPCKQFFATGTCQYGDKCYFSHDDSIRPPPETPVERPPLPGPPPGGANLEPEGPPPSGPEPFGGFGGPPARPPPTPASQKPPNWKTKICTSWDRHGTCSYGDRCGFAHGPQELRAYGPVIEDAIKLGPGPGFHGGGPPFPGAGTPPFGGPPGPRPNGFPQEESGKDLTLAPGLDSAKLDGSKATFEVGPLVLTVDLDLIHGDSIFEEDLEDESFNTGAIEEKDARPSEPEPGPGGPAGGNPTPRPQEMPWRGDGFEGFRPPPEGMPPGPWMGPGPFFRGGPGWGEGPPRGYPPFGPRGPGYHFGGPGEFGPPPGGFYGGFGPRGPPNFEGGPPRMGGPGGWQGGRGRGPGQFELEQPAG